MSVDIILKDIEWDGVNKIRVPLEGGGTQDFSIGGGSANLQTKSKTYTPTSSQQTDTVSPDSGYDGLSSVNVTVNAIPTGSAGTPTATKGTVSNHSVSVTPSVTNTTGYITGGTKTGTSVSVSASELVSGSQTVAGNGTYDVTNLSQLIVDTPTMNLPSATSSTPTGTNKANILPSTSQRYLNIPAGLNETAQYYQIIGMELAPLNVTQNGTYNASDVDITGFNTVTVNVPTGSNLQTKYATVTPSTSQQIENVRPDSGYDGLERAVVTVEAMPSGEEGTPTLIKRTASANSVSITPKVTNTAGYIPGTTKTGTAMTVSASELVSGTKSITANGTGIDVTNYASVDVNVPSGTSTCDTKTMTNSDNQATSIEFTGLSGEPKWFFVRCTSQLSRSSSYSYYFVTDIRYNGTNHYGNYYRRSNGSYYNDTSHYSHTYSNNTLTVSSSANRGSAGGSFYNGNYELVYIY